MKSIEKLREYAETKCGWGVSPEVARHIKEFADAIEREVTDEWKAKDGQSWLHGYAECHAELLEGNETLASDLERCGWIRLPVDADGVPIHVGDVMDSRVDYLFDGKPFTVRALVLCEDGWEAADGRFGNRYEPDSLRHHHAPTVEDVLTEFGIDWEYESDCEDRAALLKEYAAKLRLAEGSE